MEHLKILGTLILAQLAIAIAKLKAKVKAEPVLARTAIAFVLGLLVQAGVIDTGVSATLEDVLTIVAGALIVGSGRQAVIPVASAEQAVDGAAATADPAP